MATWYKPKRADAAARGKRLYDNRRWRKASQAFLVANPLCVLCASEGRVRASEATDHVIPHRGSQVLFWNMDNWQALCRECHNRKSAKGG